MIFAAAMRPSMRCARSKGEGVYLILGRPVSRSLYTIPVSLSRAMAMKPAMWRSLRALVFQSRPEFQFIRKRKTEGSMAVVSSFMP